MTGAAREIPIDFDTRAKIGTICAIAGQIEAEILVALVGVLRLSVALASKILHSSNVDSNLAIWYAVIQERTKSDGLSALAKRALKLIQTSKGSRNSLIHALFVIDTEGQTAIALNSRTLMPSGSLASLTSTHDNYAQASKIMAHINWCLMPETEGAASPWSDEMDGLLLKA